MSSWKRSQPVNSRSGTPPVPSNVLRGKRKLFRTLASPRHPAPALPESAGTSTPRATPNKSAARSSGRGDRARAETASNSFACCSSGWVQGPSPMPGFCNVLLEGFPRRRVRRPGRAFQPCSEPSIQGRLRTRRTAGRNRKMACHTRSPSCNRRCTDRN